MSYSESHIVTLVKPSQRQLQEKVIRNNVKAITQAINSKALSVRGWTIQPAPEKDRHGMPWVQRSAYGTEYSRQAKYVYGMFFRVDFSREDGKKPKEHELGAICRTMATRVTNPNCGRWTLSEVDDKPYVPVEGNEDNPHGADSLEYSQLEIPEDWDSHFSHLYGLDYPIAMIRRAMEAGILSQWKKRYHCALIGPPGCGKSDICQSIKRALGDDAVMEFDATSTTAAGAIKELTEREILPRVLVIEEIEKAPEQAMLFLLGVLDLRAEVRKVTARSNLQRETKLFAVATVNDEELFKKLQAGALASRFSTPIRFKRPTRDQLQMILEREVDLVEGDRAWIDPAIEYCEQHDINDPRQVTAICLCGREMLLTGEYQKMLTATSGDQK